MKIKEKKIARELRTKGWSLKEIRRKTGVAKSSISIWVRDIELTKKQQDSLSKKGIRKEVIERRRKTRLENENIRRQKIIDRAKYEIKKLSLKDIWLIGIALYWGEGAKTLRSGVQFSNSDPNVIQIMIEFFKRCCGVSEEKFRGHVHIHSHLCVKKAEKYWSDISGIPLKQFYKTSFQQSRVSKRKKDNLPFGTFNIQICNTELFLRIKGWIQGVFDSAVKKNLN